MPYYDNALGKVSTDVYVYGFNFPLDPTKTVSFVSFDNNTNRFILAVDAVDEPSQVNLGLPGSTRRWPDFVQRGRNHPRRERPIRRPK